MLISTFAFIVITAISLLTTVYVATNFDIQDYYFLKDIFVSGIHNSVIIEPTPTTIFETFEQANILFDTPPPPVTEEESIPSFEEIAEASPTDLVERESVAPTNTTYPWVLFKIVAGIDLVYIFAWFLSWLCSSRPPPQPPPVSPPVPSPVLSPFPSPTPSPVLTPFSSPSISPPLPPLLEWEDDLLELEDDLSEWEDDFLEWVDDERYDSW
ncbi:hypothetical protein K501DRAFT_266131 [Backusella circina FSU 941]|nr:hypothetical protein K501DRAFT_266131 [Backusella circina FSU 941]